VADSARIAMPAPSLTLERSAARVTHVPWYVWSAVLAVTSTTFGLYWDISWHTGIGRDSFWTPAHMAIQFGAVLSGLSCAYLILHTTFASDTPAKKASVRVFGFRGPLGAFIAAWGGFVMLTSAPFDNWWHDSFGLDVKILSPPHVVLLIGIIAMGLGGLILIVGQMNRASGEADKGRLNLLLLYVGSLLFSLLTMLSYEYVGDNTLMHSAIFYRVVGMLGPLGLIGIARASGHRWAATIIASFYTVLWLAGLWIFPLFPAQVKLGPVFTPITHMIPLGFPLLIIPGAAALDYILSRFGERGKLVLSSLAGAGFLAVMLVVQWPFGNFLNSPMARNWIFGMNYFGYFMRPSDYHLAWEFTAYEKTRAEFWVGMGIALVASIISARLGLAWGDWMRRIRR
jgi:hypothetical protein